MRRTYGSVTRLDKNRYRLRFLADLHDGRGRTRHSVTVRGTRVEANRRLAEIEAEHGGDRETITIQQCHDRFWLPDCEDRVAHGTMRRSTLDNYEQLWGCHVRPRWGATAVTGVRPLDYQEWLLTLTAVVGRKCNMLVRSVLRFAVLYGLLDHNWADAEWRYSGDRDRHADTTWSLPECERMCAALRNTVLEVPVIMMAIGSCRVGEACGIRAADCKLVEANGMQVMCCHVMGQLARDGYRDWTKTPQSMRWVVVPEPWSPRLSELLGDGRTWLNDDGLGEPVKRPNVSWWWRNVFREGQPLAGMEYGPIKNLRASWRTNMRDALGVDRDLLEKMMGHTGRGVGEVHYYRPDEEAFADAVSAAWLRYRANGPVGKSDDYGPASVC